MLNYIVFGFLAAVIALAVYVRLVPINGAAWHAINLPNGAANDLETAGSYTVLRDVPNATAALEALDAIIMATPRTQRVAGTINEGRITYITRSRIFGFPDYTTIAAGPVDAIRGHTMASLAIYGRLRFGKADIGVNKARIQGWLSQFDKVAQ